MAKKEWTEEERKAFGAKMKAARLAKKENKQEETPSKETKGPTVTIAQDELQNLLNRIEELKKNDIGERLLAALEGRGGGQILTSRGVVGTEEKYILDPDYYPDPRERLSKEKRLERFAFKLNYELGWKIETTSYDTRDGRMVEEPKFTLDLIRIVMDEETGEPTNRRYVVCRLIFHEDPVAAVAIARENGLPVEAETEKTFLDEMRYLRMRDWLLESFYPPIRTDAKRKKEVVIGNRLVEIYEVNSEKSERIPWEDLKRTRF